MEPPAQRYETSVFDPQQSGVGDSQDPQQFSFGTTMIQPRGFKGDLSQRGPDIDSNGQVLPDAKDEQSVHDTQSEMEFEAKCELDNVLDLLESGSNLGESEESRDKEDLPVDHNEVYLEGQYYEEYYQEQYQEQYGAQ